MCSLVLALTAGSAHAVILPLESRLGGQAYYDPNLDITWATNAALLGAGTWDASIAAAASLDIGGVTGWRLPSADVNGDDIVDTSTTPSTDNEMSFLYHVEGITNTSPGPFTGVNLVNHWSGTELSTDTDKAWQIFFNTGVQITSTKTYPNNFAWAVRSGDVPEPASGQLLLLGMAAGILRRHRIVSRMPSSQ